jgi:hypothetical protein
MSTNNFCCILNDRISFCEPMKMFELIKKKAIKWVGILILINFMNVQQMAAQAPNCEECDDVIDDPIAYAECLEENCGTNIPVDGNIWVLILGGLGMGGYAIYKYDHYIPKANEA